MKVVRYWIIIVFAGYLSCSFLGCAVRTGNTRTITRTSAFPRILERAKKDKRYFFMDLGKDTFAITSVIVEKSKQHFTVHLNRLDSVHRVHLNNLKTVPEKHIHVFVRDTASYTLDEPHTIPLAKVEKIELIN